MRIIIKIVTDAIIFILMLLFIYAATFKLLDFTSFKFYLGASPLFGKGVSGIMAAGIPLVEFGVATLLFMPRFRLMGLYASLVLMLGFTAYIAYYVVFNMAERPCACGGILNSMGWTEHLIFNIVFTLMSAAGIFLQVRLDRQQYKTSSIYRVEAME